MHLKERKEIVIMDKYIVISGDIIIGDPCEMVKSEEDWQACEWGEHLENIGFKNYICAEMEEECPNVIDGNGKMLGTFCTDSCMVAIVKLDDLLAYNPTFDQHISYPKNWTIIKDFNGTIKVEDNVITGDGNISFCFESN